MKKHHERPHGQVKMKGAFRDMADADQKLETWRLVQFPDKAPL